MLRESERKRQLNEIVNRHLTGLVEKYRFPEVASKSPGTARDLALLCYEELKSELFLKNLPIRSGEILSLFDQFFKGSHRDYYLEIIQLDLELYFLTLPDEEGAPAPAPKGLLEEIVEEETRALKKVYRDLLRQPSQYLTFQEKTFAALLQKLAEHALTPTPEELFQLFRASLPGIDEVYFKPLNKFRERIASLPQAAKKAAPPIRETPPEPPRREEPRPSPPVEIVREETRPSPAKPLERPQPMDLFKKLVDERKLPPPQYYSFIKGRIAELENLFGAEKDFFHKLIFSLYKASQKFRDKIEELKGREMDDELINAGYLNAALSIAFAKSAEGGGMHGQKISVSVG